MTQPSAKAERKPSPTAWRGAELVNALVVVVALASVGVVVATTGRVGTSEVAAREDNVLGAFRDEEVTRVVVERGGRRTVLERTLTEEGEPPAGAAGAAAAVAAAAAAASDWRLVEPVIEAADEYGVDKLLGTLEFARVVRRIKPEEVDRAGMGLDAPRARLEVVMGRITYRLSVCGEAPSPAGASYVEVGGVEVPKPGVVVVPKDFVTELTAALDDLRERLLLPYSSPALARLELRGAGGDRLLRKEGPVWRFEGMEQNRVVAPEQLDVVLTQFGRLKVETFVDAAAAEAAQKTGEQVELRLVPAKAGAVEGRLVVGGRCPEGKPGVVVRRLSPDPVAGCVPESVMPGLSLPVADLVDTTPFALRDDEVESVEVVVGERKLAMDRSEKGFRLRSPREADVELEVGNARVASLVDAQGQLVSGVELAAVGLAPPAGRATLRSSADDDKSVVEETVEIGKPDAEGVLHVRRVRDGAVLALYRDAARAFSTDAALVRSRRLLEFRALEFRSLEVEYEGVRQRALRSASGEYSLELPAGAAVDGALTADAGDVLGNLVAERWVADTDDGSYGLERPRLTAKVTWAATDGATREATLRVGAPTLGGHFAALASDPGVFVLSRRAVETLSTLLLDRAPLVVPEEDVARVELTAGDALVTLERKGERFVVTRGALTPEALERLVEGLFSLRAEAALHLGKPLKGEGLEPPLLGIVFHRKPGRGDPVSVSIGAGDSWRGTAIHYARAAGVDATYALSRARVSALLDAL